MTLLHHIHKLRKLRAMRLSIMVHMRMINRQSQAVKEKDKRLSSVDLEGINLEQ